MFAKPEKKIKLYYFKCLVKGCKVKFGILHTSRSEVERNWIQHALGFHVGKVEIIPPYRIRHRTFKRVKE